METYRRFSSSSNISVSSSPPGTTISLYGVLGLLIANRVEKLVRASGCFARLGFNS